MPYRNKRNNGLLSNYYYIIESGCVFKHLLEGAFKIQRIEFTSYDASMHFIVFGANIGSLYVYHIENISKCVKVLPCNLVKPIIIVSISPCEDNILFVDETGVIIVLEKCFSEKPYKTHIFNEQKGRNITSVKWDGNNKIYTGDSEGTIAVLSIKSKLMLSLLHTPHVSLMDLHSRIIQIEVLAPLLLITTEKKTYICNQEQETYRQVGTQETAKGFGACFMCNSIGINLYCSRPGLRLWQVDTRGGVFSTQKYKGVHSLITEIIRFDEGRKVGLQVEKLNAPIEDKTDFGKVYSFAEKFLCIINSENIFILDPEGRRIIFHLQSQKSIDVRIVKHKLFIKYSSGKISILDFCRFEELMNEIYFKKQYSTGIEILLRYRKNTMNWLKCSPNIKLVTNLEQKIANVNKDLAEEFTALLNEFRMWEKEKLQEFLDIEDPKIDSNQAKPQIKQILEEKLSEEMQLMCKKYDLFKTCNIIFMPQFTEMLLKLDEDEMAKLFLDFIGYKTSKNVQVEMNWCYKEYIHHFSLKKGHKNLLRLKVETTNFLKDCYVNVEAGIDVDSCSDPTCNFPLPSSKRGLPKYDKVGKALVKYKFCQDDASFKKKPYFWYHKLSQMTTKNSFKSNLPTIVQLGYIDILQKFKSYLTYNICHELVKLFLQLKQGKCLNCGTAFTEEHSKYIQSIEKFVLPLISLIGSDNVLRILSDNVEYIPEKESLSERFYLGCIFSEIETQELTGENAIQMALNFLNNLNTQQEFRDCISAFLMGKVDKTNRPRSIKTELITCSSCEMTLQHPLFKEVQQLECGHDFHAICLRLVNNSCTVCTTNK